MIVHKKLLMEWKVLNQIWWSWCYYNEEKMLYPARWNKITVDQSKVLKIDCSVFCGPPGMRKKNSYDIFVHGSKFLFIDGINLNLTHDCVCCEIIFVFTYIALVVFVYKVKKKKKFNKNITKNATNGFRTHAVWMACASLSPLSHGVNRSNASVVLHCYNVLLMYIRASRRMITCACARDKKFVGIKI